MLLPSSADSLDNLANLTKQFGPMVGSATSAGAEPGTGDLLNQSNFRYDGLDICIISKVWGGTIVSITISRSSTFNSMEIPDILKMLSSTGDWTQKDDSNWTLSHSKITAHWNGEGRIEVGSD